MKTNFKETIVKWSRSNLFYGIWFVLLVIGIYGAIFFKTQESRIFARIVTGIIAIFGGWMKAIQKQKDIVIQTNKLTYIILSDYDSVWSTIFLLIYCPLVAMISILIDPNVFWSLIVVITIFAIQCKVAKRISNHFKKKLIIPKEEE